MSDSPDSPPLPDLHQSEIDEITLRQLFADLGKHARIIEIIPKFAPGYVEGGESSLKLEEAFELLASRALRGLQVRYIHEGQTWWDTLMPLPDGRFRIVRIEHRFS
ncbi:hypothetical protein [Haloferula sp. BvORR071]|uniref:hypothetical protein n=1 Tax=Haloferula sp. BvORR071 TaxID=1396141 RepID=UPI0005507F1C|nr:hypothetical protein [Haloferula sp. BvORR071]